jgi:hypothetical protein
MPMQMSEDHNPEAWMDYRLNLPFGNPGGATREIAGRTVGNAVKSTEYEGDPRYSFPKRFGKLAVYDTDKDIAVVIAHDLATPGLEDRIWTGTIAQFQADWECD